MALGGARVYPRLVSADPDDLFPSFTQANIILNSLFKSIVLLLDIPFESSVLYSRRLLAPKWK